MPEAGTAGEFNRDAGHSLRAGPLTAAGEAEVALYDAMRQSRHRTAESAMRYMRTAALWRNNVTQVVLGACSR